MKDIRQFGTGQLFGIKVRDHSVRTGVKVATLGRFDFTRHGFVVNFTSTEGVAGSNQALRFSDRSAAERWISLNHELYGYDEDEMAVMNTVGTNNFWKVPVAGFDVDGWVNARKFDYVSSSIMNKLIRNVPEYFSDDATEAPDRETEVPQQHYRGFRF